MKFILKENQKPLFRLYIDLSLTNFTVYDYDVLSNDLPYMFEDLKEKRAKQEKYIVNSPNGYVNFMRKPDNNSKIRGRVKNGKTVSLINEKGNWYYVQVLDGGEFGYVNKEYLKKKDGVK